MGFCSFREINSINPGSFEMDGGSLSELLEIVPWPVIVLDDDGAVVRTSQGSPQVTSSDGDDSDDLAARLTFYLEALASPGWCFSSER